MVPDEAVAQILIRIVENSEPLRQKITEVVGDRCELIIVRDTPVLMMEKLDGYETDVVAFTTDLPSLTNWGRPLLLGPAPSAWRIPNVSACARRTWWPRPISTTVWCAT